MLIVKELKEKFYTWKYEELKNILDKRFRTAKEKI